MHVIGELSPFQRENLTKEETETIYTARAILEGLMKREHEAAAKHVPEDEAKEEYYDTTPVMGRRPQVEQLAGGGLQVEQLAGGGLCARVPVGGARVLVGGAGVLVGGCASSSWWVREF